MIQFLLEFAVAIISGVIETVIVSRDAFSIALLFGISICIVLFCVCPTYGSAIGWSSVVLLVSAIVGAACSPASK